MGSLLGSDNSEQKIIFRFFQNLSHFFGEQKNNFSSAKIDPNVNSRGSIVGGSIFGGSIVGGSIVAVP